MAASISVQPFTILELKPSKCANVYGVLPCTASGVGNEKCYNTRSNCQDTDNFVSTNETLSFCSSVHNFPKGQNIIPCIVSTSDAPTTITGGRGLGARAKITLQVQDFPHGDQFIDPYVSERTYDTSKGSYFGKFLARNLYYQGREAIVRQGFLNFPFSISDYSEQHYIIEEISNPDSKGNVKIVLKDSLKKIDNKRARWPIESSGELNAAILAADTSIALKTGEGADYVINEHINIGGEIILVTNIVGDVLTVTRGQWNTEAKDHSISSKVQLCATYTAANIVDIIYDLLTGPAEIPASRIISADWEDEKTQWTPTHDFDAIITKPTGCETLVNELLKIGLLDLWDDADAQTIRLKASSPYRLEPVTINDSMVVENTIKIVDKTDKRISRAWVKFGFKDPTKGDDEENIKRGYALADSVRESANVYGDIRAEVLATRWLRDTAADRDHAFSLVNRLLSRFGDNPKSFEFSLFANSEVLPKTGDVVKIETEKNQDLTGAAISQTSQIMSVTHNRKTGVLKYKALAYDSALNAGAELNNITLSTDQYNYNLWLAAGSPPSPITVTLTIDSEVSICSTSALIASLVIGSFAAGSIIYIINNGVIMGAGGNGGNGGGRLTRIDWVAGEPSAGVVEIFEASSSAENGGDAIAGSNGVTLNITNNNLIAGGNGGVDGVFDSESYNTYDDGPNDPVPLVEGPGGNGGDGCDPGLGGTGFQASDGTDGIYNEATAGLGLNPGAAINSPDSEVNILVAGTINGATVSQ